MSLMRDLNLARQLPRERWLALGRAALELAVARVRLGSDHARQLVQAKRRAALPSPPLTQRQERLVDDVAFAIPRVADRLPWRADCLVQALAAERWLRRRGVVTQLAIGVKKSGPTPLDAHAWLKAGERIVIGGDIAAYAPFAD